MWQGSGQKLNLLQSFTTATAQRAFFSPSQPPERLYHHWHIAWLLDLCAWPVRSRLWMLF